MKKTLQILLLSVITTGITLAQVSVTGPSSSQTPYVNPTIPSATITSIITATQTVGSYTVCGLMDGAGAWDNGDGTFSMLINHEMSSGAGSVRAHGQIGAFVSKFTINKSTLAVSTATDLIQKVNIWTGSTYTTYSAVSPSTLTIFNRFCSADLPHQSAFWNEFTDLGTKERIFMNGEEGGP